MAGLYKCIERLSTSEQQVDKISIELETYRKAIGIFGMKATIRQRTKIALAQWWKMYGTQAPILRDLAIKVLSLTCSSSGCEHNWSTFEHRSKLEHQKLQDLVFIKYNQALKQRFESRDVIDPILLKDIHESNEWLVRKRGGDDEAAEDDFIFHYDTLTWGTVVDLSGAGEE
ncbi:uncharacterized protein LOC133307696 [Gastrolobium bilobum]|uniref:uncharacterized protein LOC133307696 n=1 Tax=Gastrolobium bilobum TaxID=150636 RepID=UPI002AB2861E|nr:uncharacterized protein LOC133307696 [Gastrolobium bilobum]